MRRFAIAGILILVFSAGVAAENHLYVVNGTSETLSRIDLETGEVENHIVTLGAVPNQVVYNEDMLYVVNSFSPSLMVIDPGTNSVVEEIALPVNSNPWNVALAEGFAYVTGLATALVYKIDPGQGSIVATFATGQSPEGVIVYEGRLYVANTGFDPVDFEYGQGTVSIIDLASGNALETVNVGKNPQALAVGPDGIISIICTGDYFSVTGMIYFLEPSENTIIDSISTGGTPVLPVINQQGIGFVAAGGWVDSGYIYSYDAVSRTVLRGSDNPILVGTGAIGIALDSLGYLYCACLLANSVTKFDAQGTVVETYPVGSGPVSLALIDSRTSIDDDMASVPDDVRLGAPYPNPFNSSIVIPFTGNEDCHEGAEIEIFDCNGRTVSRLSLRQHQSIYHSVTWNGVNLAGEEVVSGVYFARLKGTSRSVKMVLLR